MEVPVRTSFSTPAFCARLRVSGISLAKRELERFTPISIMVFYSSSFCYYKSLSFSSPSNIVGVRPSFPRIDNRIHQYIANIGACFTVGNQLNPDIKGQLTIAFVQPLINSSRASIIRGTGQNTVIVIAIEHIAIVLAGNRHIDRWFMQLGFFLYRLTCACAPCPWRWQASVASVP